MKSAGNTSMRPMGPAGSETWHAMLDAAEDTLREEGFRALTSRRVAERVGFKQRLVYYYFSTMDDLIVETFRRVSVRELGRLREATASQQPLHQVWDVCVHALDPRLVSEFMALAHRIHKLKREVKHFIEESRRLQADVLSMAIAGHPKLAGLRPAGLAILASSVALSLLREKELGVDAGHADVTEVIARYISAAEPESEGAGST